MDAINFVLEQSMMIRANICYGYHVNLESGKMGRKQIELVKIGSERIVWLEKEE